MIARPSSRGTEAMNLIFGVMPKSLSHLGSLAHMLKRRQPAHCVRSQTHDDVQISDAIRAVAKLAIGGWQN